MIPGPGGDWGTAAEIAERLGTDVTVDMVRWWARAKGLARAKVETDSGRVSVHYPFDQAAKIERDIRLEGLGRPRAA